MANNTKYQTPRPVVQNVTIKDVASIDLTLLLKTKDGQTSHLETVAENGLKWNGVFLANCLRQEGRKYLNNERLKRVIRNVEDTLQTSHEKTVTDAALLVLKAAQECGFYPHTRRGLPPEPIGLVDR